jgi:hypothetical protein
MEAAALDVEGGMSRRAVARVRGTSEAALRAYLSARTTPPAATVGE